MDRQGVDIYNNKRKHFSLDLLTPDHVHNNATGHSRCHRKHKTETQKLVL